MGPRIHARALQIARVFRSPWLKLFVATFIIIAMFFLVADTVHQRKEEQAAIQTLVGDGWYISLNTPGGDTLAPIHYALGNYMLTMKHHPEDLFWSGLPGSSGGHRVQEWLPSRSPSGNASRIHSSHSICAPRTTFLSSFNDGLNDASFLHYMSNSRLEILSLVRVPVTDKSLGSLSHPEGLSWLQLGLSDISDDGLIWISSCQKLSRAEILASGLSDRTFLPLCRLPRLNVLSWMQGTISEDGVKALAENSQIATLTLDGSVWRSSRRLKFRELENVEVLRLANTAIDDEDCRELARMPRLQKLDITGTKVTNRGVRILLSQSARLESLIASRCNIDDGVFERPFLWPRNLDYFLTLETGITASRKQLEKARVGEVPDGSVR